MGHLINPVSLRLSINSYWNSNWSLINNFNFVSVFKKDYTLFIFLNWFTKKLKFLKFNILVSHYKIYRIQNKVYINIYYYDANSTYKKRLKNPKKLKKFIYLVKKTLKKKWKKNKIKKIFKYILNILILNLYWSVLIFSIKNYLGKINSFNENFYFNVYNLNLLNISVQSITTYITFKLQQKFSLNWVLRPVLKDLTKKLRKKQFSGYKLVCSGRFTRKQIATYTWYRKGSVKFNTLSSLIKYSEARVRLKYGLCGIKLWINYDNNNLNLKKHKFSIIYPIYQPFKYKIDYTTKSVILYLNYWYFFYIKILFLKLKTFKFYSYFLNIKIKIIINNLFNVLGKNLQFSTFNLTHSNSTLFNIKLNTKKLKYSNSLIK